LVFPEHCLSFTLRNGLEKANMQRRLWQIQRTGGNGAACCAGKAQVAAMTTRRNRLDGLSAGASSVGKRLRRSAERLLLLTDLHGNSGGATNNGL
jgi:hypothetical protein